MKQSPKTISESKRLVYVKKNVFKCNLLNLDGQLELKNVRKYQVSTHNSQNDTETRYELDVSFQGKLKALGPKGFDWYSVKEIKDHPTIFSIHRVNNCLRPKLLKVMACKLEILGFRIHQCQVKKIALV